MWFILAKAFWPTLEKFKKQTQNKNTHIENTPPLPKKLQLTLIYLFNYLFNDEFPLNTNIYV